MSRLMNFDYAPLAAERIDEKNGIIYGVTVLTAGKVAKGHDLTTDFITVQQMLESAKKHGDKICTKLDHRTGIREVNGYLTNFRVVGPKLIADWELMQKQESYQHTLELCQKMSDIVGLSASFVGEGEQTPQGKMARCTDLVSVDFVTSPAVNTGLFETKVDKSEGHMSDTNDTALLLQKILANQNEFSARLGKIEEFNSQLTEAQQAQLQEAYEQGIIDEHGNLLEDEDEEDDSQDTESEEEVGGDEEGSEEFAALRAELNELKARFVEQDENSEMEALMQSFASLNEKVQELTAQRDHALALLEEASVPRTGVSVSGERMFSAITPTGADVTEFEKIVAGKLQEFEAAGKPTNQARTAAISFAVQNFPNEYQEHLARPQAQRSN